MAMREVESEALGNAMTATDKEIAGHAWGDEDGGVALDETGDRSVEEMGDGLEGQHEPDDDEGAEDEAEGDEDEGEETGEETGAKPEVKEPDSKEPLKAEPAKEPEGRVPPGRLREQTERAKAAEAERDALKAQVETSTRKFDELNAKFDGVLAVLQRQQAPAKPADNAPKPEELPDIFENPRGFTEHLNRGIDGKLGPIMEQLAQQRVETSMAIAHAIHRDGFSKAFEAVQKLDPRNPDDQMTVRRIYAAPNPGEALVQWHKRNETLREVGDDPLKYREKVASDAREALVKDPEFRKQLIEELRAEASGADGGRPNTITRLPKSLNGAAGTNRGVDRIDNDDSDQAVAESAWR